MNVKKFLDDFKSIDSPVDIVGEIVDWNIDVECKCRLCNDYFNMRPTNLKRGSIHSKCSYKLRGKHRNSSTQEFKDKLQKINDNIDVIGEYEKAIIPIKVKCKICGHIWEATPNNLLRGHGCPSCHYNKLKKSDTDFKSYNIENIKNDILNKFSNLTIVNEIKNLSSDASCECKKCGYKWTSSLRKLSNLKFDECCPMCSGNIFNIEELLEYLDKNNIDINQIPRIKSEKIDCVCKICGYEWETTSLSLLERKGCPKCNNRVRKTHEEFLQELNEVNPNVELLSEYVNNNTKIKRRCLLCGDISIMFPNNIKNGNCKGCASIKMRNLFAKTHEEFCEDFKEKYGDTYVIIDKYVNSSTVINIKHSICNNTFKYNPSNLYNKNKHICPYCYNSNSCGEQVIENYFCENNVEYQIHKTFPSLRGVGNGYLSYDFYLEKYNLLIEFQGAQHYEPVDIFGGEERFKIQQEHDRRKRQYAKNNNISLLEIPYWDYNNIEEILSKELDLDV